MDLAGTVELREFGEDELQCVLDALIWILLDPVAPDFHIACSNTEDQRAATRLLLQCFLRALAEQRQLQRSWFPSSPAIADHWDAEDHRFLVDDDGPDQSTELDQSMPVA